MTIRLKNPLSRPTVLIKFESSTLVSHQRPGKPDNSVLFAATLRALKIRVPRGCISYKQEPDSDI